jgi:hypothetical protein
MEQNLLAAQVLPNGLSVSDRRAIEKITSAVQDGKTNYFQLPHQALTAPRDVAVEQTPQMARVTWHTAYAGDEPVSHYEIVRDGQKIGQVAHHAQTTKAPFVFEDEKAGDGARKYEVAAVDIAGRRASEVAGHGLAPSERVPPV